MSRTSVVTSKRSQQQNSGDAMRFLMADQQLTQPKSNVNHAAINRQKLKEVQQVNKVKQAQAELISQQPVFKMNRFANVGSKVMQHTNGQSQSAQQQRGVAAVRPPQPYTPQPDSSFQFNDMAAQQYNAPSQQPVVQYNNENTYNNNGNYAQHNDYAHNDESIYNAFSAMSVGQPVVAVHDPALQQPAQYQQSTDQSVSSIRRQSVNRVPSMHRQPNKPNTTSAMKRASLKAPLDMTNTAYTAQAGGTTQRNFERDNAMAVINARTNRPTSSETGSFKHANHGQVPAYLSQRKAELEQVKAEKKAAAVKDKAPPGTVRMSEEQRLETLQSLNEQLVRLNNELLQFPLRITTEARRIARQQHEAKINEIENAIELFNKKIVYISQ